MVMMDKGWVVWPHSEDDFFPPVLSASPWSSPPYSQADSDADKGTQSKRRSIVGDYIDQHLDMKSQQHSMPTL